MKKLKAPRGVPDESDLLFGNELRESSRLLLRALKLHFDRHGITLTQYLLLRQLGDGERLNQVELAERLGTTPPATVATVDSLEKRGFIKRVRDTVDRRVVWIVPTPKGQTMQSTLLSFAFDVSTAALKGLKPAEIAQLRASLTRVRENLESAYFEVAEEA